MRTLLAAALAAFSLGACTPQAVPPPPPPKAQPAAHTEAEQRRAEMLYTVVRVSTADARGSGTILYTHKKKDGWHTFVLTNHHVVDSAIKKDGATEAPIAKRKIAPPPEPRPDRRTFLNIGEPSPVHIEWFNHDHAPHYVSSDKIEAKVVAYDEGRDLALLEVVDEEYRPSHTARMMPLGEYPIIGDEVFAVGGGLGEVPFMTSGILSLLNEPKPGGYAYMLATSSIIFGNSGGALFAMGKSGVYELIGVPSRISMAGFGLPVTHMGWSVPIDDVRAFLARSGYAFVFEEGR